MGGALEGHRRYLAALRAACAGRPGAHAHQLAVLEREAALAADAGGGGGYSGAVLELARAAWLDRAANHARVAAAVGDPWSARAAALEYVQTAGAADHAGWAGTLGDASAPAEDLRRRSADARSAFTSLLHSLLRLQGAANELERTELCAQAAGSYAALREIDPAFAWSQLDELPRYLWRTPWTGRGRETVGRWIDELGAVAPPEADEPDDSRAEIETAGARWRSELDRREPVGADEVPADVVVAPYSNLAAALTGDDRASVAIRAAAEALAAARSDAATGPEVLARFVEDRLLVALAAAPLLARAEEALERQAQWPDPLVEHHWTTLAERLADARSETEVDLVSVHAEACFAVEADWNGLLLGTLLAPLRAACTYGWDGGDDSRAAVVSVAAATHALVGVGPRRLLAVPRVAGFVAGVLVPLVSGAAAPLFALEGEAGFDLIAEAQAWTLTARGRDEEEPPDAGATTAALRALFDRAGVAEPASAPQPVSLWGAAVELDDLAPALARPSRPPVPGLEPVDGSGTGL